jgi:PAS domain S-box-containing protein
MDKNLSAASASDLEALRESELRFRRMADSAPAIIWVAEPDGRTTFLSRGWLDYTGQAGDEALGYGWLEAVHPQDRERAGGIFRDANARHEAFSLDYRLRRADGEYRWALDSGRPRFDADGRFLGFVGSVIDVHERKRAEDGMRESEARYRTLFESIDEGFCIIEVIFEGERPVNYRFLEVNPAFSRQTGLDNAAGRLMRELAPAHEEHWFEIYGRVAMTGEPVRFENTARQLGRMFDVYAFRIGAPEQRRVAVLFYDITARKRAEDALQAANERLLEADRRKNEFLAMLSHELRNPLAPIRNGLYILERAVAGGDQARRAQDVMARQVEQLARLVDDLLDVTRVTRNKIELQRQRLELNELVRRTLEDYRPTFDEAGVQLELESDVAPLFVDADWNRIAQVIGNLLQNAAKFTPRGGRVSVSVSGDRAAGTAAVRVADSGVGMTPETLACIFEPFTQADSSLDRNLGGLGLGLALVKGLVELHGGAVAAESEGLGRGSAFTVRLPLEPVGEAPRAAERQARAPARRRVLVIEDNRDGAETLRQLLELEHQEVAVAHDGLEGLAKAHSFRPALILCDIGLPGMDGYEVARALRADQALANAVLVALSGYALPEDLQRAASAGFDRHLAKPARLEDLEALLHETSLDAGQAGN